MPETRHAIIGVDNRRRSQTGRWVLTTEKLLSMNPFQCFLRVQVGPSRQSPRLSSKGLARLVGVSFLLVATVFSCAVVGGAEDSSAGPAMVPVPELQTGFRF